MNELNQGGLERLTDRNVAQLDYAAANLGKGAQRQQPGSRPDGGMLSTTQSLLTQVLETERQLRNDLEESVRQLQRAQVDLQKLGADLDRKVQEFNAEREARQHLEGVIRQIADVVVNGRKAKGT